MGPKQSIVKARGVILDSMAQSRPKVWRGPWPHSKALDLELMCAPMLVSAVAASLHRWVVQAEDVMPTLSEGLAKAIDDLEFLVPHRAVRLPDQLTEGGDEEQASLLALKLDAPLGVMASQACASAVEKAINIGALKGSNTALNFSAGDLFDVSRDALQCLVDSGVFTTEQDMFGDLLVAVDPARVCWKVSLFMGDPCQEVMFNRTADAAEMSKVELVLELHKAGWGATKQAPPEYTMEGPKLYWAGGFYHSALYFRALLCAPAIFQKGLTGIRHHQPEMYYHVLLSLKDLRVLEENKAMLRHFRFKHYAALLKGRELPPLNDGGSDIDALDDVARRGGGGAMTQCHPLWWLRTPRWRRS